jgi:transcription initiation factor TFIID subunit 12
VSFIWCNFCIASDYFILPERNHNIRIPGFDETRISLAQSVAPPAFAAATGKKNAQGPHLTLRSQRLAQVQQAKREAKLM